MKKTKELTQTQIKAIAQSGKPEAIAATSEAKEAKDAGAPDMMIEIVM